MKTLSLGSPMFCNFMCLTSAPPKARIALLANTLNHELEGLQDYIFVVIYHCFYFIFKSNYFSVKYG